MKKLILIILLINTYNIYGQLTPLARTGDISDSLTAFKTNIVEPAINDSADILRSEFNTAINNVNLTTLPSTQIFVGNLSNEATAVAVSGDISITDAGVTSITTNSIVNADINASAGIDAIKIANGTVTSTEFQYIGGLTSDVQTQISDITTLENGKIYVGNNLNAVTEVTLSGDATITSTGIVDLTDASVLNIIKVHGNSYSIPISYPQNDESFLLTQSANDYTITAVTALLLTNGGGDESLTFNLNANSTNVFSSNQTVTAYTTSTFSISNYNSYTTFADATIPALNYIAVKIGTVTGIVYQVILTVYYIED